MKKMAVATQVTAPYAQYEQYESTIVQYENETLDEPTGDLEGATISCYENDIPGFVEADMDRIYGSIYSSLVQFRIYDNNHDTSTYIVRKAGTIITVFLFRIENRNVRVVNEVIRITEGDIARFAHYIFSTFASVDIISFKAIETNVRRLPFPFQHFNYLEDIVLTLPDSAESYKSNLGKNTRRNIKRYSKKLIETFPSFSYRVYITDEVDERTIREIVALNKARMADKNKISAIDPNECERIFRLAKTCGIVGVATIDGKICAGAIAYRAGSNYYLSVIAHDPQYDPYWLGILCCYFTIGECIAREGKEFHFLWGEYEYKYTLLGMKRNLDNITIYRSRRHVAFNSGKAIRIAYKGYARQIGLWLHDTKRKDTVLVRLALKLLNRLRSLARMKTDYFRKA